MPPCPTCQQPASKRNGRDRRGRQKYACSFCRHTFTENTTSAFSGYRWPPDVILTAVRWYLSYLLSSRQARELLAERGVDVSHRTVLLWVQVFGPLLAAEVRGCRRVDRRWFVDDVFLFRKSEKRYLYRAIDEGTPPASSALSGRPGSAGRPSRAGRTDAYARQHSTSFRTQPRMLPPTFSSRVESTGVCK